MKIATGPVLKSMPYKGHNMWCPSCGSSNVEYAYHMSQKETKWVAWCESCEWHGKVQELVTDFFRFCIRLATKKTRQMRKKEKQNELLLKS